jgi:hypothetical protein
MSQPAYFGIYALYLMLNLEVSRILQKILQKGWHCPTFYNGSKRNPAMEIGFHSYELEGCKSRPMCVTRSSPTAACNIIAISKSPT